MFEFYEAFGRLSEGLDNVDGIKAEIVEVLSMPITSAEER